VNRKKRVEAKNSQLVAVLFELAVFRYLRITATENTERSKGKITNQDNSGTEVVGFRVEVETGVDVNVGVAVGFGVPTKNWIGDVDAP
jgi:hypothetical protein